MSWSCFNTSSVVLQLRYGFPDFFLFLDSTWFKSTSPRAGLGRLRDRHERVKVRSYIYVWRSLPITWNVVFIQILKTSKFGTFPFLVLFQYLFWSRTFTSYWFHCLFPNGNCTSCLFRLRFETKPLHITSSIICSGTKLSCAIYSPKAVTENKFWVRGSKLYLFTKNFWEGFKSPKPPLNYYIVFAYDSECVSEAVTKLLFIYFFGVAIIEGYLK